MKVFYSTTYKGVERYGGYFQKIADFVQELGYQLIEDKYFNKPEQYDKDMQDADIRQSHYKNQITSIKKADFCIFETSTHSLGIGFMTMKSLDVGKPTIVLYHEDNVPVFLAGIEDDKLIVKKYTKDNLKKVLREAIDAARERRDKRFNFFISPKLLEYLEKTSTRQGVTKSKFIRNLITDHMRREKGDEDEEEDESDFAL